MRTEVLKIWVLSAAVLAGLASCTSVEDNPVNPVKPVDPVDPVDPEVVVDKGKWTVNDEFMDLSVKPGDNFFMYCNGNYWKNISPEALGLDIVGYNYTEMRGIHNQRVNTLERKSLAILKAHAADGEKTLSEAKAFIEEHLKALKAAKTIEEAWKESGRLLAQGFSVGFSISPYSREGKIHFVLDDDEGIVPNLMKGETFMNDFRNDPAILAALSPIVGPSKSRGSYASKWPMVVAWCEGMGIDPAYMMSFDVLKEIEEMSKPGSGVLIEKMALMLDMLQTLDLDTYKSAVMQSVYKDLHIMSEKDFKNEVEETLKKGDSSYGEVTFDGRAEKIYEKMGCYEESREFAEKYVTASAIDRISSICQELKQEFSVRIKNNEWMSQASKTNALEKLNNMPFNIGMPKEWIEAGLPNLSKSTNLVEDLILLRKAMFDINKEIVGKPTNKCAFHALLVNGYSLTTYNAFYYNNFNSMFILPAFMLPLMLEDDLNEALIYAGAITFGHEISHGFDNRGALCDKYGDPNPIWGSEADKQEFNRRATLLSNYFSTLLVLPDELPGLYADGAFTLAENIADLGGFEIAYQAYSQRLKKQGFTGSELKKQLQRFYRGYANIWRCKYTAEYAKLVTLGEGPEFLGKDDHSQGKERVNGLVVNTDAWYDLFGVTADQKMYLPAEKRIHIW